MNDSLSSTAHRWEHLYNQVPLCDVPRHFAGVRQSPFTMQYLTTILKLCPPGSRSCETGIGTGYSAIWLSQRGVTAEGLDLAEGIVERARQINQIIGGSARFFPGDLFAFYREDQPRYQVIHHQGVLEHFAVPWIRAALAQQVASAQWVVFSVPSVHYPFDPEFGDERLLPLEEWQRILEPFDVVELKYYGDPQHAHPEHGSREHILCVLRGQEVNDELQAMMTVPDEPYPEGISAIVHTRNESRHIADCLGTLKEWTDEIIVCDMESDDSTVEIARGYTDQILRHPLIKNFDRARNASAMRAGYRWVFYLDADERVPPGLAQALRHLTETQGENFEALLLPFRHHFAGHWMQCLYPGYTAPRLFKNGRFFFNPRLHSGASVNGRISTFPADDPNLALVHYSFDSLSHYLNKLNRYTDGEADNMQRDGQMFHWQHAIRHFVTDFRSYYDHGDAPKDGVHGFLYSFLSGFYRFEQHAKLFEQRYHQGRLQAQETALPSSVEEVLEYALRVVREKPLPRAPEIKVQAPAQASAVEGPAPEVVQPTAGDDGAPVPLLWSGPLGDPSGYGEESRNFVFGLAENKVPVAVQALPWSHDAVDMSEEDRGLLQQLGAKTVVPGFTQIIQDFPSRFRRHPQAGLAIGRTMFETDRLPQAWVQACNRMDAVWVPSEFNRRSFRNAGVAAQKLAVIPGCLDTAPFHAARALETHRAAEAIAAARASLLNGSQGRLSHGQLPEETFVFLSVFDWTLHKGWDVLLQAFLEAFEGRDDVALVFKVWSTMGYDAGAIRAQAADHARRTLDHDLTPDRRVRFVTEQVTREELHGLYRASDAFVLSSRGEGWGRPYMESMAWGKPTIGTAWSGNTAFMTDDNSYLINCRVQAVPEIGWREIPTYKGHCWAEPDREHLKQHLQQVESERGEAAERGQRAREQVLSQFDRRVVARQIAAEVARLQEERQPHPRGLPGAPFDGVAVEEVRVEEVRVEESRAEDVPESRLILPESCRRRPVAESRQEPVRVRWEGAQFTWHSLAHVNRELCLGLIDSGRVELALVPTEPMQFRPDEDPRFPALAGHSFAPLTEPADVHVRHFFPPRLTPPAEGKFVLIQPWEYGYLPQAWIEPIQTQVDEVWCYSRYVRDVYLASGIAEEKLQVVPLGVDPEVFRPDAPPYIFTTEAGAAGRAGKLPVEDLQPGNGRSRREPDSSGAEVLAGPGSSSRFTFLFAGGTLHRKGIDILLEAYFKAFTALDEVCLVIKDTGTRSVYQNQNERERILELIARAQANRGSQPPLVYLDDDLSPAQLAGIYTASDCLVQPYRGEGFCLPVLEAMACGCPAVVPAGGPTDDFVDETVGWRIAAQQKPFAIGPNGNGRIGDWECVGPTWQFEVAVDDLARLMRSIYSQKEEAARRGAAAAQRAREQWTWQHASEVVLERLAVLREQPRAEKPRHEKPRHENSRRENSARGNPAPGQAHTGASIAARHGMAWRDEVNPAAPSARRSSPPSPLILPASEESLIELPVLYAPYSADGAGSNAIDNGIASLDVASEEVGTDDVDTNGVGLMRALPTISLCMIVRNEERVLGDCLQSVKPWVDEIILVDTGSTDRTVDIAREHGARVFEFPWCDDFSAARNESIRHATGDWIFWMDADDTLPESCGRQLHDLVLTAQEQMTGFIMQVHIPPAPGDHGFTIVDHVKLFRNRPELRFEGRIHEQILEPIHRSGGRVERSDLHVVHSGYDYSPEGQARKRERDLLLLQKDLEERPDHPFVLFNIGMTAFHLKDFARAEPALERCLQRTKPQESIVRKVYAMLAGCRLEQGDVAGAKERVEQGLALFPHDPELLFRAGIIYREVGDLPAAEASYHKLLTEREVGHIDSIDVSMTSYKAHHNLALIYQDRERWPEAEAQWRAALKAHPQFVPSWLGLGELLLRQRRLEEVREVVAHLTTLAPERAQALQQHLSRLQ